MYVCVCVCVSMCEGGKEEGREGGRERGGGGERVWVRERPYSYIHID